jgi:anti-anti-sigma factor
MRLAVTEEAESALFLAMEGRLDFAGIEKVGGAFNTIVDSTAKDLILDVAGVSFMASLGMSLLVSGAKRLHSRGLGMVMVAPQGRVREVWTIAALHLVLPVADDRDKALAMLPGNKSS